jgi:NhaP-type Na+/H+ or K+/H+ antiporter
MELRLLGYGALTILAYALVAKRLNRTIISGPMLFTAVGMFAVVSGISDEPSEEIVGIGKLTLEVTLALLLFTEAMPTRVRSWREDGELPFRLLVVALPLVMIGGFIAARVVLPDFELVWLPVLAIILAPTDASLGQPVVSNTRTPKRIREALSIESGLNDGLAVPFLFFFLSIAEVSEGASGLGELLARNLILAPVVGVVIAWVAGRLVIACDGLGWMLPWWRSVSTAAVAIVIFVAAEKLGGSGFIAAFVGGVAFGRLVLPRHPDMTFFSNDVSKVLTLISFMLFGAISLEPSFGEFTGAMLLYAVLSLTVVRIAAVAVAMIGAHLRWQTVLYMGWFGPRGLASIVFAAIVVEDSELPDSDPLITVVILTVAVSILLHGVTAYPGSTAYADWSERRAHPDRGEHHPVGDD